ncbi:M48 family metallopeptidase [Paenacidovorax monticola]|uniref:M48 family metallopeptidase n=1 Tax=Paenacidovorax monticola TaxID=1926868 RepID=A0A7H0HCG8_9BURK|nr:M48 family metallopeptidase [Paenacidovorax monticola]MBO9679721.1 M48 family metallopeptidase [Acidovorax sp.]QNP58234.1 M48 family metallopeptidase [Paenacidovorax monticola]
MHDIALPLHRGCALCAAKASPWNARRGFLLAAGAAMAAPALAQVDVGNASGMRKLVPAETLETSATQQYSQMLAQARAKGALAPEGNPQLQRLHAIARRLIPYTAQWNDRARQWRWEVNLIGSKQINAFCMPGGKIAFYTGILDQLKLTDDETAMVMGHEMAHALREHARSRLAKSQATSIGLSLGAQLLGLGDLGNAAANLGTQLLTLKFSRTDETDADLVGLELAARAGYNPEAAVNLWRKMGQATGGKDGLAFLSTHPSGPDRIRELEQNVPKVQGLYQAARKG